MQSYRSHTKEKEKTSLKHFFFFIRLRRIWRAGGWEDIDEAIVQAKASTMTHSGVLKGPLTPQQIVTECLLTYQLLSKMEGKKAKMENSCKSLDLQAKE